MLTLENLSISVLDKNLISNLSVTLMPGSITYLKGENGSGKTSLLRCLSGIKKCNSGKIYFQKKDISDIDYIYNIYVGHKLALKNDLTVFEQLKFWGSIYNSNIIIPAVIKFWNLEEIIESKISKLSAGNQKKLALSRLFCCFANLWLLDEVETNLDQKNKELLHSAIYTKANTGGVIIIATHMNDYLKNSQIIDLNDYFLNKNL